MVKKFTLIFLLICLFLTNCDYPGGGNTPARITSSPEIIPKLPTPTTQPQATVVATPTNTQVLQNTPSPTTTPDLPAEPSPTPFPDVWYILQPGTPLATYNIPHETAGCSWLGVGGQVFEADTAPVLGLSILVGGSLDGNQVGSQIGRAHV